MNHGGDDGGDHGGDDVYDGIRWVGSQGEGEALDTTWRVRVARAGPTWRPHLTTRLTIYTIPT